MSPIVNTPAAYPVVAPKASTPLPSPKRVKLSSFVETVPDSESDVEGNATQSTTISGSGQTSLPSISFQEIPQNPSGLPNYDCDAKKSQTGIIPASPKATATLAELDHDHESAKVAIALKLMYINLIKELHSLLQDVGKSSLCTAQHSGYLAGREWCKAAAEKQSGKGGREHMCCATPSLNGAFTREQLSIHVKTKVPDA